MEALKGQTNAFTWNASESHTPKLWDSGGKLCRYRIPLGNASVDLPLFSSYGPKQEKLFDPFASGWFS